MSTELVPTHPCPKCQGVDKLTCDRCDGSGRVGNRTRAEQVAQFLRDEDDAMHEFDFESGHEFDLASLGVGPRTMAQATKAAQRLGDSAATAREALDRSSSAMGGGVYLAKNRSGSVMR